MSDTQQAIRTRLKLWLMAERAMGLPVVEWSADADAANAGSVADVHASETDTEVASDVARRSSPTRVAPTPRPSPQGDGDATRARSRIVADLRPPARADAPAPKLVELSALAGPTAPPFATEALTRAQKIAALEALDAQQVRGCTKCRLSQTRTHTVFGEGDPDAPIFFIGEGPGETEDLSGRPFVGKAGQLLDKMIASMGLSRQQVFIANIVKCRPPDNRVPAPDEVATCTPYLERQLEIVRPRVIVTLGRPASLYMLQTNQAMGKLRGIWHAWRGIKLMPTFHPSYVLRTYTREVRDMVWSDLKQVMAELGLSARSASM